MCHDTWAELPSESKCLLDVTKNSNDLSKQMKQGYLLYIPHTYHICIILSSRGTLCKPNKLRCWDSFSCPNFLKTSGADVILVNSTGFDEALMGRISRCDGLGSWDSPAPSGQPQRRTQLDIWKCMGIMGWGHMKFPEFLKEFGMSVVLEYRFFQKF